VCSQLQDHVIAQHWADNNQMWPHWWDKWIWIDGNRLVHVKVCIFISNSITLQVKNSFWTGQLAKVQNSGSIGQSFPRFPLGIWAPSPYVQRKKNGEAVIMHDHLWDLPTCDVRASVVGADLLVNEVHSLASQWNVIISSFSPYTSSFQCICSLH
jgi:hypothetical protein